MKKITLGLLAVFVLAGCQATSQYAGTNPIQISSQTAQALEQYFNINAASRVVAISPSGASGWTSCPSSNCSYRAGSAEKQALQNCSKRGTACSVFAIDDTIVWKGPVTLKVDGQQNYIVKLAEIVRSNYRSNHSGTSYIAEGAQKGSLSVNMKGDGCAGSFDLETQQWSLSCPSGSDITGTIGEGSDSLFWGRSDDGRYEISIARKGWPILEEKIRQHSATYSGTNIEVSAPQPAPSASKIPAEISASQKSAQKVRREAEILSCIRTTAHSGNKRKMCECTLDALIDQVGWERMETIGQSFNDGTISEVDVRLLAEAALKCSKSS